MFKEGESTTMEYLIHVIDESSQHKKDDLQEFKIVEGQAESGEVGDVVKSDAFYLISDKSPVDAIISISNIITTKDSEGKLVPLSSLLSKTKNENENSSIEDDSFLPLSISDLKIVDNTNSELIKASCQIVRYKENESWVELHNIYFYIVQRDRIIFVK